MKHLKLYILSILFIFAFSGSYGQMLKKFTHEKEKYYQELTKYLEASSKREEAKVILKEFEEIWLEGIFFSDEMRDNIYNVSDAMLKKKARQFPHFGNYVRCLMTFSQDSVKHIKNYKEWENGILHICAGKKTNVRVLDKYLKNTLPLLKSNSVYKSATTEWRANSNNYKFIVDKTIKIVFNDEINLTCFVKKDSIYINATRGVYYPILNLWKGFNGEVTWEKAGYAKEEVFAHLRKYQIDMKRSHYKADSVIFLHKKYFRIPILGALNDKVQVNVKQERVSYPKFTSYTKRLRIDDIYENVDYDGGFSMEGFKLIGSGDKLKQACLYFYRKDTLFLTARSKHFSFNKKQVIGQNTNVTFRLDTDSIYHPGLLFKYLVDKNEISLIRNNKGMARSPYFNTYHNVSMEFELLSWKINEPKIDFKMLDNSTTGYANFESIEYFREDRFNELQGMDRKHPLIELKDFAKYVYSESFTAAEYANYLRMDVTQVRHVLMDLSYKGFVIFDTETDEVEIKQLTYDYIIARGGKKDYDVMKFTSVASGIPNNASLNLLNLNLKIFGVNEIFLSDSQNVVIFPAEEKILLKRNRCFEFDGKVKAGYFLYKGTNFNFNYDNFKIDLQNIEYAKFQAPTGKLDPYGFPELKVVRSKIENISGNILIDNPLNKSGVKNFPQYPIFNSKRESFVYYDSKAIQKGVYDRDKLYFQIYPYTLDSLNDIKKENLQFKGYFSSGGVFPDFEESLTVQKDYSLGFIRSTPPGGFPVYGGKAKFENDIKLSNKGLEGDGIFKYVTSTTWSKNFIFFPDSMNAISQRYNVKKQTTGIEFPTVEGSNVYTHFIPNDNQLFTSNKDIPFIMYDDQALHKGTLVMEPKGLSGLGKIDFTNGELISETFKFKSNTFDADTADFNLKSKDLGGLAFKTLNINAHIDFINRKGVFKTNSDESFVEFPENQYICYIDQFTWYMDKEEIDITTSKAKKKPTDTESLSPMEMEDLKLEGSDFISIHPKQDSLRFKAPTANYSLKNHRITAKDVQLIRVADATIYPSDGVVVIEKKAKMRTLKEVKIRANNTTRYHNIYNSTINIYGKKDYAGSGDYDYVDETNRKQTVHFDVIAVDTTIQTYATGKIGIADDFTLSPNFGYTGKLRLNANNEYLTFNGSAKIRHECDTVKSYWVNFESEINPKLIYIPISDTPKDINNENLFSSIFLAKDSAHIYSSFLNGRKKYSDIPLVNVDGFLHYSKRDNQYKISSKEKLVEFNMPGNYLSLHKNDCKIYGEGKLNLGANLGQIKLTSVGNISHDIMHDEVLFDLLLGVDFYFSDASLKIMADKINAATYLSGVDNDRKTYTKGLTEIMGQDAANKIITEINLYGSLKKLPEELIYPIFFSDLKLKWNTITKSYISEGSIGIGSIMNTQMNKYVSGTVEIIKKRSGDILTMYLELDEANWFFFEYRINQMLGYSTFEEFNTIIKELKPDKRKMDVERGEKPYIYWLGSERRKNNFLKKFEEVEETEEVD